MVHILIQFLVPLQHRQRHIQVIREGDIGDIAEPGGHVLDVHLGPVGPGAELVGVLLDDEPAGHDVVLLPAPVVGIEVETEVFFAGPEHLVLVDELAGLDVLEHFVVAYMVVSLLVTLVLVLRGLLLAGLPFFWVEIH